MSNLVGGRFTEDQIQKVVTGGRMARREHSGSISYHYVDEGYLPPRIVLQFDLVDTEVLPFLYTLTHCDPSMEDAVRRVWKEKQNKFSEAEVAQRLIGYHFERKAYGAGSSEVNTIEYHLGENMMFQFTRVSGSDLFELVYCDASMSQVAIEKFGWVPKTEPKEYDYDAEAPENLPDWSATDHGTFDLYGHRGPSA